MRNRISITNNRASRNYSIGFSVGTHPVTDRKGTRLAVVAFLDLWLWNITVRVRDCPRRA